MIIIFGSRGMVTTAGNKDHLQGACPECGNNLDLKDLKRWFTLFFIPVFPFHKIDTFYQCDKCKASYKSSAREALMGASKSREELAVEAKHLFARALAACMTHMANIDGYIASSEEVEINNVIARFPDFSEEMIEILNKVKSMDNADDYVFGLLKESQELLTSDAIMSLISQAAKVLMADGKIEKEEEQLMKEYLVAVGLPKSLYSSIIEKMK